jgi:oxidase EvaA
MNNLNISNNSTLIRIFESWAIINNPMNSTEDILSWIQRLNEKVHVKLNKIPFSNDGTWYYDKEELGIVHKSKAFFKIKGLIKEDDITYKEQPIIIQNEIGYLGIIGKVIDEVLYFLMQAKIEPGNINKIQISPTIQATKSNFMQVHGGKVPAYFEYFYNKKNHEIIVDQIQSEQSSRFFGKRNRNIIILIDDEIEVLDTHRWMTIGQIKQLMKHDNLVNMDTRTVLSCIPFSLRDYAYKDLCYIRSLFHKDAMFNSIFFGNSGKHINEIYQYMNEIKMLDRSTTSIVDLYSLKKWRMINNEFTNPEGEFKIIYCDIEIEGREVSKWQQPLLEATGQFIFALFYCVENNCMQFLVHTISEVGCFDKIEIGPSIQLGPYSDFNSDCITRLFFHKIKNEDGIIFSGLFSEEGGRFYHEQNRNTIIEIRKEEIPDLPEGYFWIDYQTLNILIQFNNCLNIQLRNLISILGL